MPNGSITPKRCRLRWKARLLTASGTADLLRSSGFSPNAQTLEP
ncbi:MAG TPA: hypothetical protein VE263_12575 [Candidatus Angelobacter sp.]|nr:hypothetical protein [Candidatus Angelobacter sp.]